MIAFEDERPPAGAEERAEAERALAELGHHVPASYAAFLDERDGGVPVDDAFDFVDYSFRDEGFPSGSAVRGFLGVRPDFQDDTLVRVATVYDERVPHGVLPISTDTCGNLICLDGRDGRDGPVLFWEHEAESEDPPPTDDNLSPIAPDFASFLAMLAPREPLPERPKRRGLKRLFR